jgi:hypothetical protein
MGLRSAQQEILLIMLCLSLLLMGIDDFLRAISFLPIVFSTIVRKCAVATCHMGGGMIPILTL